MPDRLQSGTVVSNYTDRSYMVETSTGEYRRNRVQLNKLSPVTSKSEVPSLPNTTASCYSKQLSLPPSTTPMPVSTPRPITRSATRSVPANPTRGVANETSPAKLGTYVTRAGRSSQTPARYDGFVMNKK